MKNFSLLSLVLFFTIASVSANNLRVTGGTQVSEDEISFTISWENSWNVLGKPNNHDAVWIFVKYRVCGSYSAWTHALLSTNMADYSMDGRITPATPVSLNDRFGNLPTGATETNGLGNNTGIMIRRSDLGKGDIQGASCTVKIVQDASLGVPFQSGVEYEIKVIGIEMVWINTVRYMLGDGASAAAYRGLIVENEDAVANDYYGSYQDPLPAAFPKGYQGFYCMKYEITQGQYYELLATGANMSRSPADYSGLYRNNLTTTGTTTPDRAQNFMSWHSLAAYLDWACLRPMTEMEYEKVCVGPPDMFHLYSYAWGTTSFTRILYVSGTEDGTETAATTGANCHCFYPMLTYFNNNTTTSMPTGGIFFDQQFTSSTGYNFSAISSPECEIVNAPTYVGATSGNAWRFRYNTPVYMCGSDQSQDWGPVGAGIFSRNATESRESSGASYYGVMEMSGNVWEQCMSTEYNESYTGVWGNGYLNLGHADVSDWPTVMANTYICLKGGGYGGTYDMMRVAGRNYYNWYSYADGSDANGPINSAGRRGDVGGRGVR